MLFEYIAYFLSSISYLFPPFRQYRGRYFIFFLIFALGNPITLLLVFETHINPKRIICLIAWSMLVSLFNPKIIKSKLPLGIIISLLLVNGALFLKIDAVQIISILLDYLILVFFIKEAVIFYKQEASIHTGYFVLILYSIGLILKLYLVLSNINFGQLYFYFTDTFEIFVAVFFTIYKVEKSPIIRLQKIS